MNIKDFEYSFPSRSIGRARDYLLTQSVKITSSAPMKYESKIKDTQVAVSVKLNELYNIEYMRCSCSFDSLSRCSHTAAVLLKLKEMLENNETIPVTREYRKIANENIDGFSREYLENITENGDVYSYVYKMAMSGAVKILSDVKKDNERCIDGEVSAYMGDSAHNTGVVLNGEGLVTSAYCSCGYSCDNRVCRHNTALLCRLYPNETEPDTKSDLSVISLIKNASFTYGFQKPSVGGIMLEPFFENDGEKLLLGFRIGKDRMYILNDLAAFLVSLEKGEIVKLGKAFEYTCMVEAFDQRSQSYIKFIAANKKNIGMSEESNVRERKFISLSSQETDRLFEIAEGGCIQLGPDRYIVVKKNPEMNVSMKKGGKNGFVISLAEKNLRWIGEGEYCYIIGENEIYVSDSSFRRRAGALAKALMVAPRKSLNVARSDAQKLYSAVILPAKNHINFSANDEDITSALPAPLESRFYIGMNDEGTRLVGKLTFTYKNISRKGLVSSQSAGAIDAEGEASAEYEVRRWFKTVDVTLGLAYSDESKDDIMHIISDGVPSLSEKMRVDLSDEVEKRSVKRDFNIKMSVDANGGLLDLKLDSSFTPAELAAVLSDFRHGARYHVFADGSYLDMSDEAFSAFAKIGDELALDDKNIVRLKMKLPFYRILFINSLAKDNSSVSIECGKEFKRIISDFENSVKAFGGIPEHLEDVMREYQKDGFKWLSTLEKYSFGGILADDMGLGKTLQTISLIEAYVKRAKKQDILRSVVVCPSSLVYNWKSEFEKFAPSLRVVTVTGTANDRLNSIQHLEDANVIVTSYDAMKRDIDLYVDMMFEFIVIDEAQYIKNRATQAAKAIKALEGRVKLALTGTPVENRPSDLWSIFDFIMPGYLRSYAKFKEIYEIPIMKDSSGEMLSRLKKLTAPFILRRMKSEVLTELPEKSESVLCTHFEDEQKKVYTAYASMLVKDLREKIASEGRYVGEKMMVLAMLTKIRQICCHPPLTIDDYKGSSAKLALCLDLVTSSVEAGHQILLFSQFTSMLDVIAKELEALGISYYMLTGKTPQAERLKIVDSFNAGGASVFLISLKAGGTGLNLTAADIVIHYDPWWNTAAQNQATDRAYRIGQNKSVQVYKLIIKDSVEEKILELQEKKAGIAEVLSGESENAITRMSADEIIGLFDNSDI